MSGWLQRLWALIWHRVAPPTPDEPLLPLIRDEREPGERKLPRHHDASSGSHYYFDNLLDNLDRYFADIRRMRRFSPSMYGCFREIGAHMLPEHARIITFWELPATWRDGSSRPAQGMHHSPFQDTKEYVNVVFVHFQKIAKPTGVEPTNHDVFEVNMMYRWKRKHLVGGQFHVAVSPDGQVQLLKEIRALREQLPMKNHHSRSYEVNGKMHSAQKGGGTLLHQAWHYPAFLADHAADRRKEHPGDPYWGNIDVPGIAKVYFCYAVTATAHGVDGFQVMVMKDGVTARFNIDLLRTPYFFKDREKTVTKQGTTKRIFHIVRAHKRTLAGGAEKFIKTHFRGERFFNWKGYRVIITMPGYHHRMLEEFDVTAQEDLGEEIGADMAEMGKLLGDHMKRGTGRRAGSGGEVGQHLPAHHTAAKGRRDPHP